MLILRQEAFKESAKGLRWRILADQGHSIRKVDLVLGIESLWKVFLLAIESFSSSPWTIVACVVWVSHQGPKLLSSFLSPSGQYPCLFIPLSICSNFALGVQPSGLRASARCVYLQVPLIRCVSR